MSDAAERIKCMVSIVDRGSGIIIKHWIGLSIVLQLTAGAALIAGAIHFVEPVKHKKSRLKRVNKKGEK